jgi:hypothetical protein
LSSPGVNINKARRLRALDNQIRRLERCLDRLDRVGDRYSWLRVAIVLLALAATGLSYYFLGLGPAALAATLGLLAFGAAVFAHRRLQRSAARHRLWMENKQVQIARATLDWDRIPPGVTFRPRPEHPFEADLDLVGGRSLHLLLDTAVTHEGSQRLRDWLAATPEPDQIARRQALVRELAPMHTFRDKLLLNGYGGRGPRDTRLATAAEGYSAKAVTTNASGGPGHWGAEGYAPWRHTWRATPLADWLSSTQLRLGHGHEDGGGSGVLGPEPRRWLLLFTALAVLNPSLLGAYLLDWLPPVWQLTTVLILGLWWFRGRATSVAWDEALSLRAALGRLGAIFGQLENYGYGDKPHLRVLCAPFLDPRHRPSRYLARLTRLVAAMGLRQNPLLGLLLNLVLPWDAYLTYRLAQIRAAMRGRAGAWMEAWFELEALCSLATFAYLNPGYAFPTIGQAPTSGSGQAPTSGSGQAPTSGSGQAPAADAQPVFHARDLGHPLIPDEQKVCNDFTIPHLGWVGIITGSNMAGKSVFLKTVGANLALAYAGGPVNARALQTLPFRLFASMEVSDSVTDGISYFYAEVKRLKALLAALEAQDSQPLLFFIDEIFRGTNNRERLLGSQAYVRALVGKHGAGLIATHDLALASLQAPTPGSGQAPTPGSGQAEGPVEGAPAAVVNYHFRDQVVDGRMQGETAGQLAFDYVLRPGPCPTTNALKIMGLEGLPVPDLPE